MVSGGAIKFGSASKIWWGVDKYIGEVVQHFIFLSSDTMIHQNYFIVVAYFFWFELKKIILEAEAVSRPRCSAGKIFNLKGDEVRS